MRRIDALLNPELAMPSDLPAAVPAAVTPYFRLIAFVAGAGATLAVLMLITNFLQHAFGK